MSYREEIIDYAKNKDEVEKWVALKGEQKYLQFVEILKKHNVQATWQNLSEMYRYDKRLLLNTFKYMSFFEEFLRAQIWNVSPIGYRKLENSFLAEIIDKVIEMEAEIVYQGFSINKLIDNKDYINYLRNRISHNKIMLTSKKESANLYELLLTFNQTLPESYRKGFIFDINSCINGLDLPQIFIIAI